MKLRQKLELALALALINACTACGPATPAKQAKLDRVDCYAHALGPLALADAELAAKDLGDGVVSLEDVISLTTAGEQTVKSVREQIALCNAAHPLPTAAADAGAAP
jgi:hypothetical protein